MIVRLSEKMNAKIKAGVLRTLPLDDNPFADWSAHLFVAGRTQHILFSNTKSLYSTVLCAQGVTNENRFISRCFESLRDFMESDKCLDVYEKLVAPVTQNVSFAKPLNRKIIGTMTELVKSTKILLIEQELSPHQVSFHLNDILMSAIASPPKNRYLQPKKAFQMMVDSIPR